MPESTSHARYSPSFWLACILESSLLVVALGLAYLFGQPLFSDFHWSLSDFLLGVAAGVPLFFLFWYMLGSELEPLARIRRLLVSGLRPFFASWSLTQLAVISILAGLCEEVLFRSVIQGALAEYYGPLVALIIASALFGAAHLVTLVYAVVAAGIGVYLGVLWLWGGNLLIPIATHAAYDFVALVYFLRFWNPENSADR